MADPLRDWMWSEACDVLARAERLHRAFMAPVRLAARLPAWEPPADILETEREVIVIVALPGADADGAQVTIEDGDLVISGTRVLPPELRDAVIHRLELPQGKYERRLALPPGRYGEVSRVSRAGCLVIALRKAGRDG